MPVLRNEMDVREEIAAPFLKELGYESGTINDVRREYPLRYVASQLGRKKHNDIPIPKGGIADYLLSVGGAGRWILETKLPDQEITADDIDQAFSYARHPEIAGFYAAVLNGRRFVLHHFGQTSNDTPLIDLEVASGIELAGQLRGLLSPASIRRECSPPKVDLRTPLAPGYRGEAIITGGWNKHLSLSVETDLPLPPEILESLKAQHAKVIGMKSAVREGRIWRDESSQIRTRLSWHLPHEDMKPVLEAMRLDDFEYVCLSKEISIDEENPSVFDLLAAFELKEGQETYYLLRWESNILNFNANVVMQGQAIGYLRENEFVGMANFRSELTLNGFNLPFITHFCTEFSLQVAS